MTQTTSPTKHPGGRPKKVAANGQSSATVPQGTRVLPTTKKKLETLAKRRRLKPAVLARMAIEIVVGERELGDFTPPKAA